MMPLELVATETLQDDEFLSSLGWVQLPSSLIGASGCGDMLLAEQWLDGCYVEEKARYLDLRSSVMVNGHSREQSQTASRERKVTSNEIRISDTISRNLFKLIQINSFPPIPLEFTASRSICSVECRLLLAAVAE